MRVEKQSRINLSTKSVVEKNKNKKKRMDDPRGENSTIENLCFRCRASQNLIGWRKEKKGKTQNWLN